MNKEKIKKIILNITYTPYLIAILASLFFAIFGYCYIGYNNCSKVLYGFDAISALWSDVLSGCILVPVVIVLAICVIYQIYYFIMVKGKEKHIKIDDESVEEVIDEKPDRRVKIWKKVFLYISYGCWILYLLSGVHAFFYGVEAGWFETHMLYGFEAMAFTLFWNLIIFSVIPILPVTAIYIIIYIIYKIRVSKGH